jgi:hypothetical protein
MDNDNDNRAGRIWVFWFYFFQAKATLHLLEVGKLLQRSSCLPLIQREGEVHDIFILEVVQFLFI